ncbi:MAG UNVERIFIED_CONTAM: hypothetical protein LVT10_17995 [Anaerolineae bacterium]
MLPGTLCDATLFEHQVRYLSAWTRPLALEVHHHDTLAEVARSILEQVEGTFALAGLSYGGSSPLKSGDRLLTGWQSWRCSIPTPTKHPPNP